jgi:hypothetical protein
VSDRSASIVSRKRKQAQVRLGPDEVAALVQAYQAGSTLEEVAAKFGVYVRTAAAHLEREGIAQRRHRLTGRTGCRSGAALRSRLVNDPKSASTSVSTRRAFATTFNAKGS